MKSELLLTEVQDLDRLLLSDRGLGSVWLIRADEKLVEYIALCRGFSIDKKRSVSRKTVKMAALLTS